MSFDYKFQTCTRAQYTTRADGRIGVYNTGIESNGDVTQICGYAYQVNAANDPGKLKVRQV